MVGFIKSLIFARIVLGSKEKFSNKEIMVLSLRTSWSFILLYFYKILYEQHVM